MTQRSTVAAFGRVKEPVARVWQESAEGTIDAGPWTGLTLHADDLARRGGDRVRQRSASHGRPFDFFLLRGVSAGDLKIGWPMHRLQQLRDERLGRYFVFEAGDVLEAEWVAANAPVHGVVVTYGAADQSARYRVFAAARNAGVALVGRAANAVDAALQLATPELTATVLPPDLLAPEPMSREAAEVLWSDYAARHAEPPKLRGAHPPDDG